MLRGDVPAESHEIYCRQTVYLEERFYLVQAASREKLNVLIDIYNVFDYKNQTEHVQTWYNDDNYWQEIQ